MALNNGIRNISCNDNILEEDKVIRHVLQVCDVFELALLFIATAFIITFVCNMNSENCTVFQFKYLPKHKMHSK